MESEVARTIRYIKTWKHFSRYWPFVGESTPTPFVKDQ